MPVPLRALVIGFIGGIFGGLVGLGGGVIMVPLLTLWAGLTQHEAHGTSLAAVIATGIVGAWVYAGRGAVNWSSAAWLAAAAVAASYFSARHASRIPGLRLRRYFGAFLLVVAVLLALKNRLLWTGGVAGTAVPLVLLAIGALSGGIAGLLGVGGGVLIVPLLVLGTGLPQHTAQGTSLAALILTGVMATGVYARHGHLRKKILVTLLPGVVLGCWLGGHGALGTSGSALRLLFAAVLVWLGLRYLGLGTLLRVGRPALTR